jgi:hypothetical protein
MDDVLSEHRALFERRTILPTDYADYGGKIVRWQMDDDDPHADCSCGCMWARWLRGPLGGDWCVCAKPDGPRFGLLTFEHQAGHGCFEAKAPRRRKKEKSDHG